tara:strand:- start:8580 stop:9635 length:1056 start_codon:yes stop_codon:yes gene_type:complete
MKIEIPIVRRLKNSNGNPGDIFIAEGLEYIFEKINEINWIYLDKFNQKDFTENLKKIKVDTIFIGGTPQYNNYDYWKFWYDKELWEIAEKEKLKVVAIAGGSGYPDPRMSPEEFSSDCLSSETTKNILSLRKKQGVDFTTRDPHSHKLLNDFGIRNILLPCTASWVFKKHKNLIEPTEDYFVLTPSNWTAIPSKYFKDCNNKEKESFEYYKSIYDEMEKRCLKTLICFHSEKEYNYYKKFLPKEKLFYTKSWKELLAFYSKSKGIITGRLHGAIPFLGLDNRKCHLIAVDTRYSATEFFASITKSVYSDSPKYIVEQFISGPLTRVQDLDEYEKIYLKIVKKCFENIGQRK